MPRGILDDGGVKMVYQSQESSTGSGGKYVTNTRARQKQKKERAKSVKDSLMKFLDDCGNEDLILDTADSSPRQLDSFSKLSVSDHVPKRNSSLGSTSDHRNTTTSSSRNSSKNRLPTISDPSSTDPAASDHGTHTTSKGGFAPRSTPALFQTYDEEADDNNGAEYDDSPDDTSFAQDAEDDVSLSPPASPQSRPRSNSSSGNRRGELNRSLSSRSAGRNKSAPRRTKSDAAMSRNRHGGDRDRRGIQRSESMRRRRSEGGPSLGSQLSGLADASSRRRMSLGGDDNQSVGSCRSFATTGTTRSGKSLGLDAGPLNAFINANSESQRRPSMAGGSVASCPADAKFLRLRKAQQEKIMAEANKERWKSSSKDSSDNFDRSTRNFDDDIIPDGEDDDDQPRVKGRKGALARLKKGINKTGKVTKSTAKGTVNVVKDPKRAAKKVGGFAKDVGKETFKMVLDPTLAAKTTVKLGMDVTKNTAKISTAVGMGVAKGGYGLTKTVAKTGLNATTMVVGTAIDGVGTVVHGAKGLVWKDGNMVQTDQYEEYDARNLASRRRDSQSLLDRINSTPTTTDTMSSSTTSSDKKSSSTRSNGLGVPASMLMVNTGGIGRASWDC